MFDEFPTRNEILLEDGRDIFEEILPTKMEYMHVIDDDGNWEFRSFKNFLLDAMLVRYGDRQINECVDYWVQKRKTLFTNIFVSEIAKKYSIYEQNKELNIDYANYTHTVEYTHTEPVRNPSGNDKPNIVDKTVERMLQPAGPLGAANLTSDSIDSINHPFKYVLDLMEKWFIKEEITEWVR